MKLNQTFLKAIFTIIFAISSIFITAQNTINDSSFNKFLDDYYEEGLKLTPISATQRGDDRYNDLLLNDISETHLKKVHDFNVNFQKKLVTFKKSNLNSFDRVSYDIMSLQITESLEREKYHLEYFPFDQKSGLPISMPSMGSGKGIQPFKTVKDYEDWLKRVSGFPAWTNTAISNFDKGLAVGMVLPKSITIKMIPQLEAQTINDTLTNLFYGPIKMMPDSFSKKEKEYLRNAYVKAITDEIIPSYAKMATYLKDTYLVKARTTSGYNTLPNGDKIYQYLVKLFTTTNQSPEQIHKKGLSEVDRITLEIEALKGKTDFKGDVAEFLTYSITDKQFFPFTTEKQILDSFRAILPVISPNLQKLFNVVPKAAFEVRAVEKFKAKSSSANYQRGTEDGSRPGYFNVPIIDPINYNKLGMENLFLHEAIPGHHFQLSIQQEAALPKIRKFASYSVFSEGWALYTESLGDELGLYTDPYQKLAAYKGELWRAIRLVVDTGLHTGKINREECIIYMMQKGGISEQQATSETERYMTNPGQALSYKIGELKIKELKQKYQKRLESKFNIKNFHDAILLGGSMPLSVFETKMEEWAKTQK